MDMKRRRLLGSLGASVLSLAGCLGRLPGSNDTATTFDTCGESTPSEVRRVTDPETTATATPTTTDAPSTPTDDELHWTLDYDLLVRYAGPLGSDTDRVVTVVVAETVEDDCNPVAFARRYELEPGAEVAVEDPVSDATEGTYRLHARLANGETATKEIHVHEDGIPDYAGYTVEVVSGEVEVAKVQV